MCAHDQKSKELGNVFKMFFICDNLGTGRTNHGTDRTTTTKDACVRKTTGHEQCNSNRADRRIMEETGVQMS